MVEDSTTSYPNLGYTHNRMSILKRVFYTILILSIAITARANIAFDWILQQGKVKIEVRGDWGPVEDHFKAEILSKMLDDYNKYCHKDSLHILIYIKSSESLKSKYIISYIDTTVKGTTIKIYVNDYYFNLLECVQAVDYAINHHSEITEVINKINHLNDTTTSAKDSIWNITTIEIIKHRIKSPILTSKKYYAYRVLFERWGNTQLLDFYYSNNKYTVIKLIDKKRGKYTTRKLSEIPDDTIGTEIIRLDNIYEIAGDTTNGYLIFDYYNTFYYLSRDGKLSIQYKLPILRNCKLYREEIRKIIRQGDSIIIPVSVYRSPYNVIVNLNSNSIRVDSSTIKNDLWDAIKEEHAIENEEQLKAQRKLELKSLKNERRNNALLILIISIILNGYLIFISRIKKRQLS